MDRTNELLEVLREVRSYLQCLEDNGQLPEDQATEEICALITESLENGG